MFAKTITFLVVFACLLTSKTFFENKFQRTQVNRPLNFERVLKQTENVDDFSLGMNSFLASLFWIELLQTSSHQPLKSDTVSVEFANLYRIAHLDPRFEPTYSFGHSFLSILRMDKWGAYALLKKWTIQSPQSWQSHFHFGFHCYHELEKLEEGSQQILLASQFPNAPSWLSALGIGILNTSGHLEVALSKSVELYASMWDAEGKERLQLKILAILQKLELEKWANALSLFKKENRRWPTSIAEMSDYKSQRSLSSIETLSFPEELRALIRDKVVFTYDKQRHEVVLKESYLQYLELKKPT